MPTYDYKCTVCFASFRKVLPFGTDEIPQCPRCGGVSQKIIIPPMIHFRGNGFYKTDSSVKKESNPNPNPNPNPSPSPASAKT